jgi:anti-sigma regulatory factor (Ser/Thr protein kinase)
MGTNGSTMLKPLRQGLPPIGPVRGEVSASYALSARYEAVRGARGFTRATLAEWDLDDRFDDVALVVSELVTNALRHALPDESHGPQVSPVWLHLIRWPERLLCAVRDPSPEHPGEVFGDGVRRNGESAEHRAENGARTEGSPTGRSRARGGAASGSSGSGPFADENFGDEAFGEPDDLAGFSGSGEFGGAGCFPDPRGPAESGRGLFLVDAFSDSWGWHPLSEAPHGKVVWALFRLS